MAALNPGSAPLGQALARRRSSPLPALLLGVGLIVAVAFAALGYLESRRTEPVVILARDVPYGQRIVAEDLATVALPLHRPAQLAGLGDTAGVLGRYAASDLPADAIVQPAMLLDQPLDQPVYPNGRAVSPNMVPVPFATGSIGPLADHDRVNIGFSDPAGDHSLCDGARTAAAGASPTVASPAGPLAQTRPFACRLLSSVPVLYVDAAGGVAYLELTPYQAQSVRAVKAAGLELWGERYGSGSETLPSLERLDVGQLNRPALDAPTAPPAEEADTPAGRP